MTTKQKLLLRLACVSMATAFTVFLAGCADCNRASAGSSGLSPTAGKSDSYKLTKRHPDSDPTTVTILVNPERKSVRDADIQPIDLHFKTVGHPHDIKVEVKEDRDGKQHLEVTQTTGPHPINVSVDSGN